MPVPEIVLTLFLILSIFLTVTRIENGPSALLGLGFLCLSAAALFSELIPILLFPSIDFFGIVFFAGFGLLWIVLACVLDSMNTQVEHPGQSTPTGGVDSLTG